MLKPFSTRLSTQTIAEIDSLVSQIQDNPSLVDSVVMPKIGKQAVTRLIISLGISALRDSLSSDEDAQALSSPSIDIRSNISIDSVVEVTESLEDLSDIIGG